MKEGISMNPVAFSILGLEVRWYGIIITVGIIIGILIGKINCKFKKT